jgi:hypothetical protein
LSEDPGNAPNQNLAEEGAAYHSLPPGPWYSFYIHRSRFYFGVVVFIVVVGLPLIVLPSLRHRLGGRLYALRQAASGSSGRDSTVIAQVGQNPEPFPAQYERPIVTPAKPALPMILFPQTTPQGTAQGAPAPRASSPAPTLTTSPRRRSLKIPTTVPGQAESEAAAPTVPAQQEAQADRSLEPDFRQGEMEKEAYGFLLQWNPNVDQMVRGGNPSLQFKNWSAAKREEDTYWVRLLFQNATDKTEVAYIWEVKISTKQVTPLNYNARLLPKP